MDKIKLPTKTYKRKFELVNNLDFVFYGWANQVIDAMKIDTLNVYRPDDERALDTITDKNGVILLDANTKSIVSIKKWLCVGCQSIRWERPDEEKEDKKGNRLGFYNTNSHEVLWPMEIYDRPEGPGAFYGEIVISKRACCKWLEEHQKNMTRLERKFKCIVAHEIAHVCDYLKWIVPAFQNWRSFWKNVLREGTACDLLCSNLFDRGISLDHYDKNELRTIQYYWPSDAKVWWNALRVAVVKKHKQKRR